MESSRTSFTTRTPAPQKLLFLHVAKAAGSSVKSHLARYFPEDQQALWLESDSRWHEPGGVEQLQAMRFLAGHLAYHNCVSKLDLSEYLVTTCLRSPLEHVVSHIAWIRRLADQEYRLEYLRHPRHIQKLACKLADTDLSSPAALGRLCNGLTDLELHLLDNCQTRYFSRVSRGERVQTAHLDNAVDALKKVDVVGDASDLRLFLAAIAQRMGWPIPLNVPERNVNIDKYGLDSQKPEIVRALQPFIQYDEMLYSKRSEYSKLVTFPEPMPNLPERYARSQWSAVHCACVDELSTFESRKDGGFIIRGWAVDVRRQAKAETIWLLLANQQSGRRYYVCLHDSKGGSSQLSERPDVASALKNSNFVRSGFSSLFAAPREIGTYKLSILVTGPTNMIQFRDVAQGIEVNNRRVSRVYAS
jgi:hypothetical protein